MTENENQAVQAEVIATVAPEVQEIIKTINQIKSDVIVAADDAIKGVTGNKQAARRARIAFNNIKKACTPIRVNIQKVVKSNKKSK